MDRFLNPDAMSISVQKIDMYRKEESLNFEELKNQLEYIHSCYKTDNNNILEEKNMELIGKMKIISKIHNNNIYVLNTKIQQHLELEAKNKELLGNSQGGFYE